jgi:hypothetical protein
MYRDVMILCGQHPFKGPLEGVGPENRDFFGPWNGNERSEYHLGTIWVDSTARELPWKGSLKHNVRDVDVLGKEIYRNSKKYRYGGK